MEWKFEIKDDLVIISVVLETGAYAVGMIHIDALYDARNEYWYQELKEEGEVFVSPRFERL